MHSINVLVKTLVRATTWKAGIIPCGKGFAGLFVARYHFQRQRLCMNYT